MRFLANAAIGGLLVGAVAGPGWAQTSPASSTGAADAQAGAAEARSAAEVGGDIVVTAQKREERLLDVPIPVTAVNADTLVKQNLVQLQDVYTRIPGLQYAGGRITQLSIRGINSGGVANPTVAIIVDDVPFGATTGSGQPPIPDFDPAIIERLEVLRGPQGTLYGAASLGGLIKYVTKQPSTTDFSARVEGGWSAVKGGDLGYSLRGSVNIPIATDVLGLSVSGFYRDDPRWLDNISTAPKAAGRNVNKKETYGGRAALLFRPTDNLSITLSAIAQRFKHQYNDLSDSNTTQICFACRTPATGNTAPTTFEPIFGDIHTLNIAFSDGKSNFYLYTGRVEYQMDWATLTSITSWSKSFNVVNNDVTAVFGRLLLPPAAGALAGGTSVGIGNSNHTRKFTQEVRLASTADGPIDWLIGGFYDREQSAVPQTLTVFDASGAALGTPFIGGGPQRYREIAGFGTLTYHVNEKFDVQVGGRYGSNKQESVSSLETSGAGIVFGPSSVVVGNSSDNSFTWLVTPSYHLNPDMMVYARFASGYRPGGPNTGITGVNSSFGSDSVINYELGFKGNVIPGVLILDVSAFQIDWKNIQLSNTDAVTQLTFNSNGGKARSRGVEATATWKPWQGLSINANGAYTDAVLTQDLPVGFNSLDGAKGDRLPFIPKWTTSLSIQQEFDVAGDLTAFVGGSFAYIGDRRTLFKTNAAAATRPRYTIPSYTTVDLRAGFEIGRNIDFTVFVRNLFDRDGIITSGNRNGTNAPTARFVQPRTIGVNASYSF